MQRLTKAQKEKYLKEYEELMQKKYGCEVDKLQSQLTEKDKQIEELKRELEQAEKVKVVEHFEAYGQCRDSRRIAELESQIEEMKCCAKCSHCNTYITTCIPHKHFVRLEEVCEDFELRR